MVTESEQDAFDVAARRLERIEALKVQGQLDENEYSDLKSLCLAQMKAVVAGPDPKGVTESGFPVQRHQQREPSYGQLHGQVVRQISAGYRDGRDSPRQRMVRSVAVMAEHQAIYPGDTARLEAVINVTMDEPRTMGGPNNDFDLLDELLRRVNDLNDLNNEAMTAENASPAAKAITQTAHQSASEAAKIMRTNRTARPDASPTSHWGLWKSLVLPDVEGAFEGGAAAVTIAEALAPLAMPVAAALGVVVGAGVRSGIAHGTVEKPG